MPFSLSTFALAALIVGAAYTVLGLAGFGSTVIAMPLLAQLLPIRFAVPLMMLLDLSMMLLFGLRLRRGVRLDEFGWLAPFMLVGMLIGLALLLRVPEKPLLAVLGAFVLAYALYGFSRRGRPPRLGRAWCAPFGLIGGALASLFGTGGVLIALYNTARIPDKGQLRATNLATIMFSGVVRVVLFGVSGLLAQDSLLLFALGLVPAMLVGVRVGNRLHAAVPSTAVVKVVYAVLVLAGISVLIRAFA
ncbi:MAG: sulfite exporter TauE/SafE family protein [Betaproteobacteria bacterium]|nr:sulfite exporter TauE/SafE family protein [Betaproteobacteria bacterium]